MKPRPRKWLTYVAVTVVSVMALYIALGNAFLNTEVAARLINRKPEKLWMRWQGGWTLLPGRVHVYGLQLRGQNRKVQWYAKLDQVNASIKLIPLLYKSFRTTSVSGQGLAFRLRQRLRTNESAAYPDLTPPIPGLSNPPQPAPESLYPISATRNPWTLDLQNVAIVEVRDVWIERLRFAGDGNIKGSLVYTIRGPLEVPLVSATFASGSLRFGPRPGLQAVSLQTELRFDRFTPRQEKGVNALRFLSGSIGVAAKARDLDFLKIYLRKVPSLEIDGAGVLKADVRVDKGHLIPGTRIVVESENIDAKFLEYTVKGSGKVRGDIAIQNQLPSANLTVALDDFQLARAGYPEPHIFGNGFKIVGTTSALDLTDPFTDLRVVLDLPESEIPNLQFYNAYIPPQTGFIIHSGRGRIRSHLQASAEKLSATGEIEVIAKQVLTQFKDVEMAGNLKLHTLLRNGDFDSLRFDIAGTTLHLNDVIIVGSKSASEDGWWGHITLLRGGLKFSVPPQIEGHLQMNLRDSSPVVAFFAEQKPFLRWFENLLRVEDIDAHADLKVKKRAVDIKDLQLNGDKLEILGDLSIADNQPTGIFYARFRQLATGVELRNGKKRWKILKPRDWFEQQKRNYGTTSVRNPHGS